MKELEPKIQARPLNEFQNNSDEEGILYTSNFSGVVCYE
jgi:hypothetical protein